MRQVLFRSFSTRKCVVHDIYSLIPYVTAWRWQHSLMRRAIDAQKANEHHSDSLIVVEHPSVYTLGRGSTLEHLKFDPFSKTCQHEIHRIERGGEVTWHGPGQIVCYPILDLNYHKKDLRWYLRQMESSIIDTLSEFDIKAERDEAGTGVWVNENKIAAIGLSVSRWITMHGLSLNVAPNMNAFENIVPCGIQLRGVTSLEIELEKRNSNDLTNHEDQMKHVRQLLIKSLAKSFNLDVSITNDIPIENKEELLLDDATWLEKHQRKL